MDPNANLKELLEIVHKLQVEWVNGDAALPLNYFYDEVDRLLELTEALDGWLANGGFLPTRWAGANCPVPGENL